MLIQWFGWFGADANSSFDKGSAAFAPIAIPIQCCVHLLSRRWQFGVVPDTMFG
jgi:hypothetical protein